ncbi:hypothetical protein SeMB42_g02470 [Synchytrium endobioticum]|uniref:Cleavage/polyadenylation specificity factor A subunit N-terminal domain-containing protein n=1 Tax=Synchytrium endobioticum TaxID=286115 RepID=A0A507DG02_9FUNG|nr:hypothetical protein SeLEV6574_g01837 [Synchytrium endobioticum]TPX49828.1 hypothetical protein SeMB42_g02470 [Synchytrium endobioticum]
MSYPPNALHLTNALLAYVASQSVPAQAPSLLPRLHTPPPGSYPAPAPAPTPVPVPVPVPAILKAPEGAPGRSRAIHPINIWSKSTGSDATCIALGAFENASNLHMRDSTKKPIREAVLVGTCQGVVKVITVDNENTLESKGKSITALLVTKFAPDSVYARGYQLAAASANGVIALCGWGQVLDRVNLDLCVTCLIHHEERTGQGIMIAGDVGGNLTAFTLGDIRWKLQLPDMAREHALNSSSIRCLLSARVPYSPIDNVPCNVILACTHAPFMYIVADGLLMRTIKLPCPMNSMCVGAYAAKAKNVIVLAGTDGGIYLFENFAVSLAIRLAQAPIQLLSFNRRSAESNGISNAGPNGADDILIVRCHEPTIRFYKSIKGVLTLDEELRLDDWPLHMTLGMVDAHPVLAVLLANDTLQLFMI